MGVVSLSTVLLAVIEMDGPRVAGLASFATGRGDSVLGVSTLASAGPNNVVSGGSVVSRFGLREVGFKSDVPNPLEPKVLELFGQSGPGAGNFFCCRPFLIAGAGNMGGLMGFEGGSSSGGVGFPTAEFFEELGESTAFFESSTSSAGGGFSTAGPFGTGI